MLAPCRLQSGRLPQPGADNGAIVAQALRETVNPQQQQVDDGENRACHDQLLRQKARQRQIAFKAQTTMAPTMAQTAMRIGLSSFGGAVSLPRSIGVRSSATTRPANNRLDGRATAIVSANGA